VTASSERLRALAPRPVRDVLAALSELAARDPDGPQVTLGLRSGRALTGRVVEAGQSVLIAIDSGDAAWIEPGAIESVVVHDAARFAHHLTFDRSPLPAVAPPGAPPPPTLLQVRRKAAAVAATLRERTGVDLAIELAGPIEGEALRSVDVILDDLGAALEHAAADALGRQALAGVRRVRVEGGPARVRREHDTLVVTAKLALGATGRLSHDALRAALEGAL
jgi:hypothetical protein